MISSLSLKITNMLIRKNIIDEDNRDLYHYGFFIVISELLLLAFCVLAGSVLGITLESIVFYVAFFAFHRFAGGFHANSELRCQIVTASSFIAALLIIKFSVAIGHDTLIFSYIAECAALIAVSPADTPQKRLTPEEKKKFRAYTAAVCVAVALIMIVMYHLNAPDKLAVSILIAAALELVSVLFGRMLNEKTAV